MRLLGWCLLAALTGCASVRPANSHDDVPRQQVMADFKTWVLDELPDTYQYAYIGPVKPLDPSMRAYSFLLCRPDAVDRILLMYGWEDARGRLTERRLAPDGGWQAVGFEWLHSATDPPAITCTPDPP
jgi:hypothetical protein